MPIREFEDGAGFPNFYKIYCIILHYTVYCTCIVSLINKSSSVFNIISLKKCIIFKSYPTIAIYGFIKECKILIDWL